MNKPMNKPMNKDINKIFLFKKNGVNYLNTCGLGVPPSMVIEDLAQNYRELAKNPHLEFEYEKDISGYIDHFRRLINQPDGDFSFVRNITEALFMAAQSIPFEKEDEIIVTNLDHRVAVNCWYIRQLHNPELNLKIKKVTIPVDADDEYIFNELFDAVTDKTKVIAIPHIERYFGILFPVKKICKKAGELGILTVVDGGQSIGLIDVDFKQIGCDIFVSCLHKWYLSPMSLGTISIGSNVFGELIRCYSADGRWHEKEINTRSFGCKELGTRNIPLEKSLGSLIEFHQKWKPYLKEKKYTKEILKEELNSIESITVAPVVDKLGDYGIVTFRIRGMDSEKIKKQLDHQYRISIGTSVREDGVWLRVSLFFYNDKTDVYSLIKALKKIID